MDADVDVINVTVAFSHGNYLFLGIVIEVGAVSRDVVTWLSVFSDNKNATAAAVCIL